MSTKRGRPKGSRSSKDKSKDKSRDDEEEECEEPPQKRQKMNKEKNKDKSNLNDEENEENKSDEVITDENVTLDKIERLLGFDPNDSKFSSRYPVYEQFRLIADTLFKHVVLVLKSYSGGSKPKINLYRLTEIEFYLLGKENGHCDVFAHCDDLQYETSGNWYFHKSGNNSIEGYKHMTSNDSNSKWKCPNPNASYRGGTFKGLDITFAKPQSCFGGILIRSIEELNANSIHSAFKSNDNSGDSAVYSPGELIEGPCKCVDRILKDTGSKDIDTLTSHKKYNSNCFDSTKNDFMHFDLTKNYNIQIICPQSKAKKGNNKSNNNKSNVDNIFINRISCASPRVGLTLNTKSLVPVLKTPAWDSMMKLKEEYVMAPYRFIRLQNAPKMKKYKALIGLSLVYDNYYHYMASKFDKIENFERLSLPEPDDDITQQVFDVTKIATKTLNGGIKDVEKGRKNASKLLVEARTSAKATNSFLGQLLGACMQGSK